MSADRDIAILGAGMHPWGKWGRNFVEYGVVAAQAALADAGVEWPDVQFVSGGDTDAQRLPRLRRGRDVRAGARLERRAGRVVVRGVRVGRHRARDGARPDPRRLLRRRARDRRRHHTEGIPRAEQGRAGRRSRLAALPPARRDQPDVLRAVRPPAHGAVRRDPRRLRAGEGEERAPRPREPVRALPQGGDRSTTCSPRRSSPIRSACSTSARRATARPRSSCRSLDYARAPRRRRPGARARRSRPSRRATRRRRSSSRTSRPTARPAPAALPAHGFKESIAARAYEEAGLGPDDLDCAEVYDLSTAMELDWYEQIGLCAPGEAEKLLRDGETTIGGRVPVNPSGGLACFGEAVPAQAIAQVCELTWQIQGRADGPPGRGRQRRPVDQPRPLRPRLRRHRLELTRNLEPA